MDLEVVDNEDYEIISKKEISKLKDEVRQLKEGSSPSDSTVLSRLNQMLDLFREASISMKSGPTTSEIMEQINEKLSKLFDQNQQIAEGILAVADLVKGNTTEKKSQESIEEKLKPANNMMPEPPQFQNTQQTDFFEQSQMPSAQMEMSRPMQSQMPLQPPLPPRPRIPQPQFANPQMPSLNPMESVEQAQHNDFSDLPPLPPRPPKKGRFSF
jgi:hypothetical protein